MTQYGTAYKLAGIIFDVEPEDTLDDALEIVAGFTNGAIQDQRPYYSEPIPRVVVTREGTEGWTEVT